MGVDEWSFFIYGKGRCLDLNEMAMEDIEEWEVNIF
jgi:hypothetical protein